MSRAHHRGRCYEFHFLLIRPPFRQDLAAPEQVEHGFRAEGIRLPGSDAE